MNVPVQKLKRSNELKGKFTEFLSIEQIDKLAANHSIPHYELIHPLTGEKTLWYLQDEIFEWINTYFIRRDGIKETEVVFLNINSNQFLVEPTDKVPTGLLMVRSLYKLPAFKLNTPPGIYFLCNGDKIVYIGKAVNIGDRVAEHRREMKKDFDSTYFICCHLDQLLRIEAACIKFFKPEFNVIHNNVEVSEREDNILNNILIRP